MINPRWDEIFRSREWGMEPALGVILMFTLGYYFCDRANTKVLEIGCGTGANLWWVACEGYPIYGIDGSPIAIEKSRAHLDKVKPGWKGELVIGDFLSLPWPDNYFDAAIDVNAATCNSFEDMKAIFAEVHRVLKPDGIFHSQIFAEGTDPLCIQEGTSAMFVAEGALQELYGEFSTPVIERRDRPHFGHNNAVKEWLITTRKTHEEKAA